MSETHNLCNVWMEIKILVGTNDSINRTHVERHLIKVEIRISAKTEHLIILDDGVREIEIAIFVEKLTLTFQQDALYNYICFIERKRWYRWIGFFRPMNSIPDLPLRSESTKVDIRRGYLIHA